MKLTQASQVEAQFFLADELHPTPALNTISHAVHINGPLVPDRLARAIAGIRRRHDALRSRFATGDGAITRMIDADAPPPTLAVHDAPDSDAAIARACESLRQGLSPKSPAWGMVLLRHGPQDHTFIFSAHRIIWDESSTHILGQEITQGYRAGADPAQVGLPPSTSPGALPADADVSTGAQHWAAMLADVPPLHGFPTKHPRPSTLSVDAASVDLDLDDSTRALIARRAAEWDVSPVILECAAATYVLAAYSGQKAIAVGLPFDLRVAQVADDAIGSYTAMLPFGFDTAQANTFEALTRTFTDRYRVAAQHANTPFHAVVRACGRRTDPSANPLFQIGCVADEPLTFELESCICSPRRVPAPPQQVDLFLQFSPAALRLGFATAIIAEDMAASFVRSFLAFLAAGLREPGRALETLTLLDEREEKALVLGLKKDDEPAFLGLDLYATIAQHFSPDNHKPALVCSGMSVSYAELEGSVASIAQRLVDAPSSAEGLVGICLPRSANMVAAVLAVLRCGAAYVPLDPAFPRERLRYMVEHSGLGCIITTSSLRSLFDHPGVHFIDLDQARAGALPTPGPKSVSPEAAAYVIYTSGSTGKPKGVAVPRGAVANFLLSMLRRPGVQASDTLCAVTTLSFDIAVLELLAPLCAGGTVVIATEEEARDPRLLIDLLREHHATLMQATPITWHMLLSAGWTGNPSLRALCGGEALSPSLAQTLTSRVGELWNMYGPTETTVWSTCQRISDPRAAISVGTPIHNTTVYVVDDSLRPVPRGVEGRLFIGGAGVALGYLHDQELTAKRFVADPFRGAGRMYDTGDRARFDADGALYVVGRSDFQVKLRGFRIELGEIEARLSTLAGIEQVVCVVRKDNPENPELIAYYTCGAGQTEPTIAALRSHCSAALPSHMVPTRFRKLDALPRTPNGKVDRAALPSPVGEQSPGDRGPAQAIARNDLERALSEIWCSVLSLPSASINDSFFDLGGTSLAAFSVVQRIAQRFGAEISVLKIFEHPTIATLAQFLKGREADSSVVRDAYDRGRSRRSMAQSNTAFDVAIVGMAGRFPGARDLDELWRNLCEGRETVTVFKREELDPLVPERDRNDPNYIPARGILEDTDLFDAAFFGINHNEAELMDPQLRVFMEVAWEAFENAGYVGEQIGGLVGVWAGMGNNFYYHHNVLTRPDKLAIVGEIAAEIANEKDHIAPRVSHKLNLRGPSLSIHTACSTTLVVIENAYQALISHQVDVALAGGVDIRTPQKSGQRHEEGGVFSDDGHCRPFDAAATGTMFGEGVGAVVLKRLDDAISDHDTIHAVVKGAAVNHDGGRKVSYLAPSVEGQVRVIASALGLADIHPDTITMIEAHGTATPIGDPIEVEALTRVFRAFTQRRRYCAIGSIKGNFGHATTAAGIAGTLKAVLALRHRKIPPTLHFSTPNPRIDFASSPFLVSAKLTDWEPQGIPRRACVSSFGFCGTNAHVVFEEAPAFAPSSAPSRPAQLFLLSARHAQALDDAAKRLSAALAGANATALADAAFTTHVGRKRFEYRRCAVLVDGNEASGVLLPATGTRSSSLKSGVENPPVAFMFPGQGAQYINMGLHLYQGEPHFKDAIDRCATILAPHLGCDLRNFLFPAPADAETATQSLNNTFYTQPAIFTVSYALATLFMRWGIAPGAFIGHSIGEFVSATFSGVMELEDALRLVATRGRLMQGLPAGSMLSVRLPLEALAERLPSGADVAAVNGPQLCVVAGPTSLIGALSERLASEGVVCKLLHTSHAFHSSMMDAVVEPFLRTVEAVRLSEPKTPFVSTVTGDWIKASEVTDPSYWARHLRSTVQFSTAVRIALANPQQVLLECGPRRTCAALALQQRPSNPHRVIASMPDSGDPAEEHASLLLALGNLWLNGCTIDWPAFHCDETRRRVPLPSYSFQRQRYWIEPGVAATLPGARAETSPSRTLALSPVAGSKPDSGQTSAAGDDLTKTVVACLEELLGSSIESFDEDAQFIMLGLDSLSLTQLARTVRVRLGFEVTFRDLVERYSSTRLLVNAIRATHNAASAHHNPRDSLSGPDRAPTAAAPGLQAVLPSAGMRTEPESERKGATVEFNAPAVASSSVAVTQPFELPSTSAQLEMWSIQQSDERAGCAHGGSLSVHIKGDVDDDALVGAVQALAQSHEALRGHFSLDGRRFIIEPRIVVPVAQHDLSGFPPEERPPEVLRLTTADSASPYDLATGPLIRAAIIRLDSRVRVVLLSAHRTVCDGWSLDVLLADLGRFYSALARGLALPEPPKHGFRDYVNYCSTAKHAARVDASKAFWRRAFEAPPPPLSLSHDGRRPAARSYGASHALHAVPTDLLAQVRGFARDRNVSHFSVLLAAFSALLNRISGAADLVVGIPVAGHPEAGMEDCVGHLVNLVPLRCRFPSKLSFAALCRDVYSSILDARENARLSLGEIAQDLRAPGDAARAPLVAAVFTHVQKYAPGKLVFDGCQVDYHLNARSLEAFEINLDAIESHDGLEFRAHANSDLYSQEWLAQRLCELECLLRHACAAPNTAIEALALLPHEENGPSAGSVPANGEVDRTPEPSQIPTPSPANLVVPRNDIETRIGVVFAQVLGLPSVGVGQDFFALGGSWSQALEARAKLDKEQRIGLTPCDFLDVPTVEGLAKRYKNPEDEAPIVVTLQRGDPNKPPLLCLLGIQLYVDLALAMNDGTPVVGMHVPITYVPGRTARPSLSEIASRYLEVVRSVRPSGPYYLAGLCFGGVVAYEVARLLRQQGEEVSLVVIFDAVLPRGRHVDSLDRLVAGVRRSLREPRRTMRRMLQKTAATDERPASPFATGKKLVERLLSEAPAAGPANSGDLIVTGPAAEADVARLDASNPYLDAPLLTFRAARDGAPAWQTTHPDMGWAGLARSVQACAVESDHLGIVRPPHAKQIAAIIMRELGRG